MANGARWGRRINEKSVGIVTWGATIGDGRLGQRRKKMKDTVKRNQSRSMNSRRKRVEY